MYDDALLAALNTTGPGSVKVSQATFVSVSSTGCLVDYPGSRIPASLGLSFVPEVGEVVWVWNIDDRYFVMGPAAPKPSTGTVVSVDSGLVTLTSNLGTTVVAPYVGSAPAAGQVMKLLWHGGPFAMLMSTSPAPAAPPSVAGPGVGTHVDAFPAIDAGSFQSRWWTPQVRAGDTNLGAWFYGSKISDTIPSTAVVLRVQLFLSVYSASGSNPNFATHPHQLKPGGSPSLTTFSSSISAGTGDVDLPTTVGDALKAGGTAAGVGVNHGGNNIFNSLASDGLSGRLLITSVY